MKFYSEVTQRLYNSQEELLKAEKEKQEAELAAKRKKEELARNRKTRAKEVEDAMKEAIEARKKYKTLLNEFCKEYGAFHYTWNNDDSLIDLFNWF